jgi:hypothetical protein
LSDQWIYILGERGGEDVKIGHTSRPRAIDRLAEVNADQTTSASYVFLVALLGSTKDERVIHRYFANALRLDKGRRTEYFHATPELIEYINWLRSRWWVTHTGTETRDEFPAENCEHWLPNPHRRIARGPTNPSLLIQSDQALSGPLAGTAWDWLVSDEAQIQDYFTPPHLIEAARQAMGGIDLDAASHWLANKTHRIPDFFHLGRDAFTNDWHGRVWLNPPFGNYLPWFERIMLYVETGAVTDVCMLSPTWAFTTNQAQAFIEITSAHVLLSPTPIFWGNSEGRTGRNDPHSIVYIGDRVDEFHQAFKPWGIVMSLPRTSVVA